MARATCGAAFARDMRRQRGVNMKLNLAIVARDPATGKLGSLVANLVLPPRGTYGEEDGLSSVIWDE